EIRYRLQRCDRPMADRQLRADRIPQARRGGIVHINRVAGPTAFGLCLALLLGCAAQPPPTASQIQASTLAPGIARVWFLRESDPVRGYVEASAPMVFANGSPVGRSLPSTVFYRDFAPGNYSFTVEPYGGGLPTGQAQLAQLVAGTQTYLH